MALELAQAGTPMFAAIPVLQAITIDPGELALASGELLAMSGSAWSSPALLGAASRLLDAAGADRAVRDAVADVFRAVVQDYEAALTETRHQLSADLNHGASNEPQPPFA